MFRVPAAAVLGGGQFSVGASYSAIAYEPGDSAVETATIAAAFAFERIEGFEMFVSFEPRVGIDRDYLVQRRQGQSAAAAPRIEAHPLAIDPWSSGIGDLRIGGKYKFYGDVDSYDGLAVLANVKLPTSSTDDGIGTGKVDLSVGLAASTEVRERVGVAGYVGGTLRPSPDEVDIGHSLDFGVGVQVPTRMWVSVIAEIGGSMYQDGSPVAVPFENGVVQGFATGDNPIHLLAGLRFSHDSGVAADLAWVNNMTFSVPDSLGDVPVRKDGYLVQASYTSPREDPVVFMGAAPMALPPVNSPPTLTCRAERTSVRVGESVRLFADVNDPDGDEVTVTWATQAGTINPREGEAVTWSSQGVNPGTGPVTVRASDGYGGTSDDCEITLTVTAPPPPPEDEVLTFTCSEFPSGNTRIDNRCKAILDDVALQLRQNPSATAVITGHSDSAGAADVNTQMSMERADNAETYLVDTHGIDGGRIETASAGSSEPVADNATAEGRLQNRRIVVVVTIPAQ